MATDTIVWSAGWVSEADEARARYLAGQDATGWYERLYDEAANGKTGVPWDRGTPHPLLTDWTQGLTGEGKRALVVGCGLGFDSELIADHGYETVAFDVSATAIRMTRERFPDSPVEYLTADLLNPPADWREAFDLVVEVLTVQAMPVALHLRATAAISRFTAPGGTLLAIGAAQADPPFEGPPWPLTQSEIDSFATNGLALKALDRLNGRWRAEFTRG